MSATRDQSQKFTFVYSNLYQIYKKGQNAAQNSSAPGVTSGQVIKAAEVSAAPVAINVREHKPVEFLHRRVVAKPEALKEAQIAQSSQAQAIASLKDNLKTLNDLHARLRFMLKELEDLIK